MFITKYNDKVREALAFRNGSRAVFGYTSRWFLYAYRKSITIICLLEMDYETFLYFHAGRIHDY